MPPVRAAVVARIVFRQPGVLHALRSSGDMRARFYADAGVVTAHEPPNGSRCKLRGRFRVPKLERRGGCLE